MNAEQIDKARKEISFLCFKSIRKSAEENLARFLRGEITRERWKIEHGAFRSMDDELLSREIPAQYSRATMDDARDKEAFKEAIDYGADATDENPAKKNGVLLFGPSGSGKTCAAYARLIEWSGRSITHISAVELSELIRDKSLHDARGLARILRYLKGTPSDEDEDIEKYDDSGRWFGSDGLLIDDIHVPKLTPAYAQALYSIIESRTSRSDHLIVTCQLTGNRLLDKLAADNPGLRDTAIAIIRRLVDNCHPIEFHYDNGM